MSYTKGMNDSANKLIPKTSYWSVYQEAFFLSFKYFVLFYPYFLFLLLIGAILPETSSVTPNIGHWQWWGFMLGLACLGIVVRAGWLPMVWGAIADWRNLSQQAEKAGELRPEFPTLFWPFNLLKLFIPGVGQWSLLFIVGHVLTGLIILAPIVGAQFWGASALPVPKIVNQLILMSETAKQLPMDKIQALVQHMSAQDESALTSWLWLDLGCVLWLGISTIALLFWDIALLDQQQSLLKAVQGSLAFVSAHFLPVLGLLQVALLVLILHLVLNATPLGPVLDLFFGLWSMCFLTLSGILLWKRYNGPGQIVNTTV
jgi:uncharacterized integral membrane protein